MADGAVNQWERASWAWPILVETAANKQTIFYGELAHRLGLHDRTPRFFLGPIQDYCLDEKLPPLTILVISKSEGHPGAGFIAWNVDDWEQGLHLVYEFPWHIRTNPFDFAADGSEPKDLAERLVAHPGDAEDIYGRVRDRGMAQMIFRQALLLAYDGRCAFCGLSMRAALQAAHIIPWRIASTAQRLDPSNGLLLCATHHALFDASILGLGRDRTLRCHPTYAADKRRTTRITRSSLPFMVAPSGRRRIRAYAPRTSHLRSARRTVAAIMCEALSPPPSSDETAGWYRFCHSDPTCKSLMRADANLRPQARGRRATLSCRVARETMAAWLGDGM